jgi:hypothetical protein
VRAEEAKRGVWSRSIGVALGLALSAAAAIRLADVTLLFVPRWLALIVVVFAGLEALSVTWNILRGEAWNEKTVFDYIADALVLLPWP